MNGYKYHNTYVGPTTGNGRGWISGSKSTNIPNGASCREEQIKNPPRNQRMVGTSPP